MKLEISKKIDRLILSHSTATFGRNEIQGLLLKFTVPLLSHS